MVVGWEKQIHILTGSSSLCHNALRTVLRVETDVSLQFTTVSQTGPEALLSTLKDACSVPFISRGLI